MMSYDTVAMIKQSPEGFRCFSLLFYGDVVYIGSSQCVIQWNVVTDAVVRFEGNLGLNFLHS